MDKAMKSAFLVYMLILSMSVMAAGTVELEPAENDPDNINSLQ